MKNKFSQALNYLLGRKQEELIEKETIISCNPINNKIIYDANNKSCQVIIDGDIIYGNDIEPEMLKTLKESDLETVSRLLKKQEKSEKGQDFSLVNKHINSLEGNTDFEIFGDEVYFTGIKSIAIPKNIVAVFIELNDKLKQREYGVWLDKNDIIDEYETMKAFTFWLLLNPIESSRNDALTFVTNNNLPITKNGMIITYRKVVNKGNSNKKLVSYISSEYFRIKKSKKSPSKYTIFEIDGEYSTKSILIGDDIFATKIGIVSELYNNLKSLEENTFTDNHTKRKSIKIGQIYKEDEDKINLDNNRSCGAGLHSGSESFGFSGFGDTGVICLVNPMKIRSVPNHESNKMRSSELLPVAIMELKDYKDVIDNKEILDFSELYYNNSLEELSSQLASKSFEGLSCQNNLPQLSLAELQILLQNRIISI